MSAVVQFVTPKSSMLHEDDILKLESAEVHKEAMTVFNEMVEGGCGLQDCIAAVYMAGMDRVAGVQLAKRRKKPSIPICPYAQIVDLFHRKLPNLPQIKLMNADRKAAIRKLWVWVFESCKPGGEKRAETADQALTWIGLYFERASENDFLMGRTERSGVHANWKADIDFLCSSRGMKHVIEKTQAAT